MSSPRNELRAFGANLAIGVDALFLGSGFFAYLHRRASADAWRAARDHAPDALLPVALALLLLVAAPAVATRARGIPAALLGGAAAAALAWAERYAPALALPSGSRAPQIAWSFTTVVFAFHAAACALATLLARGNPLARRLLAFQAGAALLVLAVVFSW